MPRHWDAWTGDVWKAVFELKARPELDVRVCSLDRGCGVVLPRSRTDTFDLDVDAVSGAGFEFFVEH